MAEPWDIKLDRADEHLIELRRSIDELTSSGEIGAVTDTEGDRRAVRLVLRSPIPDRISAIVGDVVHNVRSSLDTLALAVCEAGFGGPLPAKDESNVQYPITSSSESWEGSQWRLRHISDEARALIRNSQPWVWADERSPHDADGRADDIKYHELTRLQRLSNIDKHRRVHVAVCFPDSVFAGATRGRTGFEFTPGPWVENGAVIGVWTLEEPETTQLYPQASVALTLPENIEDAWPGLPVEQVLKDMLRFVRNYAVSPLVDLIGGARSVRARLHP